MKFRALDGGGGGGTGGMWRSSFWERLALRVDWPAVIPSVPEAPATVALLAFGRAFRRLVGSLVREDFVLVVLTFF